MLNTGRSAALALEPWPAELDLTAEILESMRQRGAPPLVQAWTHFKDDFLLLRVGCVGEAHALLHDCRTVFERENAMRELGKVLSALVALEDATAGPAAALCYSYAAADPEAWRSATSTSPITSAGPSEVDPSEGPPGWSF